MNVLLLGKSGFVGRNLYEYFSHSGDLSIDAPSHAELDAEDERSVIKCLLNDSYDVVLNCLDAHGAADANYAEKRLRMFHNFAHHSDLFGKMIYFGSGAEYGRQLPTEQVTEQDFGRTIPSDSYGFALYQMSEIAMRSDNIYNLRLFGIFGKYELWNRRFISNCVCKALYGYPLTIRRDRVMDYLDIDDLCKMVDWCMRNNATYHAYNATSGKSYALTALAEEVLNETKADLPVFVAKEGFDSEYTSNNQLISEEMGGFEPKRMSASIQDLVRFYRARLSDIDPESLLYQ